MMIVASILSISLAAFHSSTPFHLARVALRAGVPMSASYGRAAADAADLQPDVSSAAAEVASLLAGKIEVAHVDHVRDWLPELEALPTPFHGGCVVDVRTTLEVAEQCVVPEPGVDGSFVDENAAVLTDPTVLLGAGANPLAELTAWKAGGPRQDVYFSSGDVRAAIVTCGGLCPGLNTVVKELVHCLRAQYGVDEVYGVPNGYQGFYSHALRPLTLEDVQTIHREAGSVLGSSRGGHHTEQICDAIEEAGIDMIFTIGGDGTMKGSSKLAQEFMRRRKRVVVAHVPKTIDNDVPIIDYSFGFGTSVSRAVEAIHAARDEAVAYPNGVGVVNLMGRHSGFIAAHATIAARGVDVCLVPEVPFELEGSSGLLQYVESRIAANGHCVVVVAEGAGQHLLSASAGTDLSGNAKLAEIGPFLKEEISRHLDSVGRPASMKYIDPTYMVRACPANAADNILCLQLAHDAVHAAFAGYSNFMSGRVHGKSVLIPLGEAVGKRNSLVPNGNFWQQLVFSTGQPNWDGRAQ